MSLRGASSGCHKPQGRRDILLDELRLASSITIRRFSDAERGDLLRDERIDDIQREDWNLAPAEVVGKREHLQRAHEVVVEAALHDETHARFTSFEHFVEFFFGDELACRRQAHRRFLLFLRKDRRGASRS
jgi:hypothetical protein